LLKVEDVRRKIKEINFSILLSFVSSNAFIVLIVSVLRMISFSRLLLIFWIFEVSLFYYQVAHWMSSTSNEVSHTTTQLVALTVDIRNNIIREILEFVHDHFRFMLTRHHHTNQYMPFSMQDLWVSIRMYYWVSHFERRHGQ